jgi:hypothetical protein
MDNNERMLDLLAAQVRRSSEEAGYTPYLSEELTLSSDGLLLRRKLVALETSTWLKNAVLASLNRDPLDALHDAEALVRIMSDVCDEVSA